MTWPLARHVHEAGRGPSDAVVTPAALPIDSPGRHSPWRPREAGVVVAVASGCRVHDARDMIT